MDKLPDLERYYELSLDSVQGLRERLSQEFALEDEYQEFVHGIIRNAGAAAELKAYSTRMSFSGGSRNLVAVLNLAASEVDKAATASGLSCVPFYCGVWPDRRLNAHNARVGDGAVIYVNTGLLVMLRMAAQYTAMSLEAITGDSNWGSDHHSPAEIAESLIKMLKKYRHDVDVRMHSHVYVMRGQREVFRRQLNYLGLCYVIAHELGHIIGPVDAGPQAVSLARFRQPSGEAEEMASYMGEFRVDQTAYRILSAPPLKQGKLAPVTAMAPMLVSVLQSGLWWMDRAEGSSDFGWTHPAPDIRLGAAFEILAPESEPAVRAVATRFMDWLWEVFQIQRWMNEAKEHE